MRITKRWLRRIIREEMRHEFSLLPEGYMVPDFETHADMALFLDELDPDEEVDNDVVDPGTGEVYMYAGESPASAGLVEKPVPEEGYQEEELDHYDWAAHDARLEAEADAKREAEERIQDKVDELAVDAGMDWAGDTMYDATNSPSMWENEYSSPEDYVDNMGQTAAMDLADVVLQSGDQDIVEYYESLPDRDDEFALGWQASRPTKTVFREIVADAVYGGISKSIERYKQRPA